VPGLFSQAIELEVLKNRFGFSAGGIVLNPSYNIAPRQEVPIVVREDRSILKMMRWGLVPFWAKEESIGDNMINARAETVTQRLSFKNSFKERRCLVLADGFYDWKDDEKRVLRLLIGLFSKAVSLLLLLVYGTSGKNLEETCFYLLQSLRQKRMI